MAKAASCLFFLAVGFLSLFKVSKANDGRNFVVTKNTRFITSSSLAHKSVCSLHECGHWCARTTSCVAFNLEKQTDKPSRDCELLSEYQDENKELLQQNSDFDYYYIMDPCRQLKCLNGGSCVTSTTGYWCVCANGYVGVNCEIPEECVRHINLSEANRNINYGYVSKKCDTSIADWVRYVGPAGSRMLDSCPSAGQKCDTDFQGWISSQPNIGEVRVQRTICWQGNNKCCNWPFTINATNCGQFNVYRILKVTGCFLRYCGK